MPRRGRVGIPGALAVVTGAGRGIGRATAEALSARGARVVAVDVDGDAAAATAEACEGSAGCLDVTDREAVETWAARTLASLGPPDVLVNNAGSGMTGRFLDMSLDDWDWVLGVDLLGGVALTRAFGPAMLARGSGQVVNVASGLAYVPRATEPGYVTAKAAVLAWSRCLRADWADHGVGVSVVCPGVTATGIVSSNTRYLGSRDRPEVRDALARAFTRGAPPAGVAAAILDAIERDRAVVPAGRDARAAWWLQRLLPGSGVARVARWVSQ